MTRSRKPETILGIERGQVRKSSVARPVPAPSPQIPASTLPSPPVAWRAARRPPESNVDVETACVLIGSWELKCECASAVNSAYNPGMTIHETTEAILGASIEVHRALGQNCLNRLIGSACATKLKLRCESPLPMAYKGLRL